MSDRRPDVGDVVWVVAGPAGSGKTVVGRALAEALDAEFVDGDDLHGAGNVAKMRGGHPLDDGDRGAWLAAARTLIDERRAAGRPTVLAISALTRSHRHTLGLERPGVTTIWLDVAPDVLAARLGARTGHFFPASLLSSQLATMERPRADEGVEVLDAGEGEPEEIVRAVLGHAARPRG